MTWMRLSDFAREYNKCPRTIKRWVLSGFIFQLGYSARRDPKGQWQIGKPLIQ